MKTKSLYNLIAWKEKEDAFDKKGLSIYEMRELRCELRNKGFSVKIERLTNKNYGSKKIV